MGKKEYIVKELHSFRSRLNKDFPVERLLFFGSMASGKPHKESDIDLIIVSDKFKGMNSIRRAATMYNYWTLKQPVDFLCYTKKEFEDRRKGVTIVREASLNGIDIN